MKRVPALAAALACVFWPAAILAAESSATLAQAIDALASSPGIGQMRVGVSVISLGSEPRVVYQKNARMPFKPASNQKLVTTAAAMILLPADFKYETVLGVRGDDLVVIGAGDPAFGDPELARAAREPITAAFHGWAERLDAAGYKRIEGELLYDDFIFEQQHIHPHWPGQFQGQMHSWWAAPVGGLNFNDNCVDVVVRPAEAAGAPPEVTLIPNTPYLVLVNRAKTAAKGEPLVNRSGEGPVTITVSGAVSRPNSPENAISIAIVDPGEFFASSMRTTLAAKGIAIQGETTRRRIRDAKGNIPADVRILAVHRQLLKGILWRVNKSSHNLFAEAILKTIAAHAGGGGYTGPGDYATSREIVTVFLRSIGVDPTNCVIDDGSGLSHDNRITPEALAGILRHMSRHSRHDEFRASLAVPGERTGTLRTRMKDLADKVAAKTGHISGVSCLSGYVDGPKGRRYAFSILCNDTHRAKTLSAHALQDTICRKLATWEGPVGSLTAGSAPAPTPGPAAAGPRPK